MENNAYITGDVEIITERILDTGCHFSALPFGPDMYAIFCLPTEEAAENMAFIKGRDNNKPFVWTTYPDNTAELLDFPYLPSGLDPKMLDRVTCLLRLGSKDHPLGVLLPAQNIRSRFVGNGLIGTNGEKWDTVGFMVSGQDPAYEAIAQRVEKGILAGTSGNYGADPRAGGSGHHRVAGLVGDFGRKNVGIFVPRRWNEGSGPSTSTVFIPDADHAYFVREGSISEDKLREALTYVGFNEIGYVDGGVKKIRPFDYSNFRGGNPMMWGLHKVLLGATAKSGGFHLPSGLAELVYNLSIGRNG